MNNTQILKIMELLDNNQKQEIKEILTKELLSNSGEKSKAKLLTTVKKFLKNIDDYRPQLKTIMHKHNKQFICNGYTMYIFNTYKKELEILPQTTEEETKIDYKSILDISKYELTDLTEDDKFILNNIKKYINYYKSKNKKELPIISFNNQIFNANYLNEFADIHENNFNNMKKVVTKEFYNPLTITNNEIESTILPIQPTETQKENAIQLLEEFKKAINNV